MSAPLDAFIEGAFYGALLGALLAVFVMSIRCERVAKKHFYEGMTLGQSLNPPQKRHRDGKFARGREGAK